jgi:hypothetical protein
MFLPNSINTCMRTKHSRQCVDHKLALDEALVEELKDIGVVASIADLNRQMGRNHTYFECMKNRGYSLHIGGLVFLAAKYSKELHVSTCVRERAKLRSAIAAINEAIQAKCQIREQELLSH